MPLPNRFAGEGVDAAEARAERRVAVVVGDLDPHLPPSDGGHDAFDDDVGSEGDGALLDVVDAKVDVEENVLDEL